MNKQFALWAPEMASNGGVQSYMWRLWEMLHEMAKEQQLPEPLGLSLVDTPQAMSDWSCSTPTKPATVSGSRLQFIRQCFQNKYKDAFILVGHPYQAPVAWLAKKLRHIKGYVVILHGIEAWGRMSWLRRLALMGADTNVTTTRYTALECAKHNGIAEQKFTVIPLCAEPQPAKPDENFKLAGDFPILFVGRLAASERYKGLDTLLEAIAALHHEGIPITLNVIGDGDDRNRMESFAEQLGLAENNVKFHGRVTNEALQAAYRQAKLFVMPSKGEGFGIVFLEAMRHGTSCIGGKHGGTQEIITDGKNGYLVEHGSVKELQQYLKWLFENPLTLHEISQQAKHFFHANYSFHPFKHNWCKLLQSIAQE